MAFREMEHSGGVKSKVISNGETIGAAYPNNYVTVVDASLAGKQFQGVQINAVAAKKNILYVSIY